MNKMEYIATIDAGGVNPDGTVPEGAPLLLDAIPVSALERMSPAALDRPNPEVLENLDYLLMQVPSRRLRYAQNDEPGWFRIQVSDNATGADGEFEVTAPSIGTTEDRENLSLWVNVLEDSVSEGYTVLLNDLGRLASYPDASLEDLQDVLGYGSWNDEDGLSVAVYDVGQGNFNAVVDQYEHPLMFFDLGWHTSFHPASKPLTKAFDPFSALRYEYAPVVLSHLDLDHWLYAIESGGAIWDASKQYWRTQPNYRQVALERPWIMRRPNPTKHKLGGSHIHFVHTLAGTALSKGVSALHIWPSQENFITVGPITIFRCDPPAKPKSQPKYLRNNEALGMQVRQGYARVLLCGDADYPSIPAAFKSGLTGMVAPHHGGAVTSGSMPSSVGHGRLVLSTYENSYPNMPHPSVLQDAPKKGWKIARTDDRFSCTRCKVDHGHRLIRLNQTPRCTCGVVDSAQLCISKD